MQNLVGASLLAPTRGYMHIHQITGQKKTDLAKAFDRAGALRSNQCKGRFDARTGLKGQMELLDHQAIT
jgi:hypothetical protein